LTLAFFATPIHTYACGTKSTKTEKSCCKKTETEKNNIKNCCKNHNSKSEKEKNGCDGKCNSSSCSCPTNHCAFALSFWIETKVKTSFAKSKKTNSYYNENYLSDGFVLIWTPPNIG